MNATESTIPSFTAKHRWARLTSRKAGLVANLIRGHDCNRVMDMLEFSPLRAASFFRKVVASAMANAAQDENVNVNRLYVAEARADNGPMLQNRLRWRPGPQGRAMPFAKFTSHLTVVVKERPVQG